MFAQSTGTITGRVYDQRSGLSLEGAIVRVLGTNTVDYTTNDGRFSVSAPAGTATVEIEYVGLDTVSQAVTVTAGGSTTLNAPLTSNILQLDSFVVQESVRGQSLAINMQKVASGIVNIVSEETFGQMIDANVGTALQRLPGISVNEENDGSTEGINIRGISGDYNSVQIDGNRAPNGGGENRAFDAKQLMADGVTNIEVIKAPTPDKDGDAIGGIINVVSRNAFQRDGRDFKLKLAGVYSDLPKKWGHAASLQYNDIFSVGGGEKNLGISLTASSYKTNRFSNNADQDWVQVTPENNPELDLESYGDYAVWFFESTHVEFDTRVTDTYGLSGSIDYRTDEFNSFYVRPSLSHFARKGQTIETDHDIDTRFQDAVGGRKTYAFLTHDSGGAIGDASRGSRGWISTDEDNYNDLYSMAFGGRHERQDSLLTYDFFVSRSKTVVKDATEFNTLMRPTNPYMIQEYKIYDIARGGVTVEITNGVDTTDLGNMTEGEFQDTNSVRSDDVYSARVDWEKKFTRENGVFTFKTGAKWRQSNPKFDRTEIIYEVDDEFPFDQVMFPTDTVVMLKPKIFDVFGSEARKLLNADSDQDPDVEGFQGNLFTENVEDTAEGSNLRDFDAEESTSAAYVMGTYRFGRHTIIGGVRFETNEWSSINKRSILSEDDDGNAITSIESVKNGNSYDFLLPGLHGRHEVTKNLILRESYNKSYGRPRLGDMTRGRFKNLDGDIEDGNPNLLPAESDNFDIQLEFYTANSGLYSVGYFYKKISNFSNELQYNFNELDANGIPIKDDEGDFEYTVPVSGDSGVNSGIELIARQRLVFGPAFLKAFTASVSATFSESEVTLANPREDGRKPPQPGFSGFLFTSSLEYAKGAFRARADYRYRDDYVEGLGDDIETDEYYAAEERVDAEISYEIRKGLSVYASGTNLTARPQVSYQGYGQFVEDASIAKRKLTVGMEYKF
ncbi:MAG: TonB-dependent receptor [Opitutus sp.]